MRKRDEAAEFSPPRCRSNRDHALSETAPPASTYAVIDSTPKPISTAGGGCCLPICGGAHRDSERVEARIMGRVYKVSYHGGALCALVEAKTPERAVEVARAHRLRKFERSPRLGKPPKSVVEDVYSVALATERDIEWTAKFGAGVLTDMPAAAGQRAVSSRKRLSGTSGSTPEPTRRAGGGTFGEAA